MEVSELSILHLLLGQTNANAPINSGSCYQNIEEMGAGMALYRKMKVSANLCGAKVSKAFSSFF